MRNTHILPHEAVIVTGLSLRLWHSRPGHIANISRAGILRFSSPSRIKRSSLPRSAFVAANGIIWPLASQPSTHAPPCRSGAQAPAGMERYGNAAHAQSDREAKVPIVGAHCQEEPGCCLNLWFACHAKCRLGVIRVQRTWILDNSTTGVHR